MNTYAVKKIQFIYLKWKEALVRRWFYAMEPFIQKAMRKNGLTDMLRYCSEAIPAYKGRGVDINNYDTLTKEIIRHNMHLYSRPARIKNTGYTSGTTGTPGRFLRDIRSMAVEQSVQARYFGWRGKRRVYMRSDKVPVDQKTFRSYVRIPVVGDIYISSYVLNDHTLSRACKYLEKNGGMVLWAFPSTAFLLAQFCLRHGISLTFSLVALSSEKLLPHQIDVIARAFRCPIKDWYGQTERVAALYRCAEGKYHEVPDYSFVEYEPSENGTHVIKGTTLHNRVMPLVRYRMDDRMILDPHPCSCGASGPTITQVMGRSADYLLIPTGIIIDSTIAAQLRYCRNIKESQFVQRSRDHFDIYIVREDGFSEKDEALFKRYVFDVLPESLCTIRYVDSIPRNANGKFQFIVNKTV